MNCWDIKNCGRIPGGSKVSELGVCPAYNEKAGDMCWLIKGTLCEGKVQSDVKSKKVDICYRCNYFESIDFEQKFNMEMKYQNQFDK